MSGSEALFQAAQTHIPGGVNSPVRAFKGVGGTPVFFKRGQGAYLFDEDDKRYIDYVGSWGPMILGHCYPPVMDAVRAALDNGLGFGAPTAIETEMADKVCELVPSMDMVRMVSSGTEATMSAIRLARGYTGRDQDREIRRLLPRPRGLPAGQSRFWRPDPGCTQLTGNSGQPGGAHPDPDLQRY